MSEQIDPIEFLNTRKFTILFSGGKDSLATLLYVINNVSHSRFNILYVEVTGNTHELCNKYVHNVIKQLGLSAKLLHVKREDIEFFECLKNWGIPLLTAHRWCLHQFKRKLMEKYSYRIQVVGIRHQDSYRRRKAKVIEIFKITGHISVKPILTWTKKQVIQYIKKCCVPLNPCYALYSHSGNCMFCPYHNKRQIILTLNDLEWGPKIRDVLLYIKSRKKPNERTQLVAYRMWMKHINQITLTNSKFTFF